MISTGNDIVSLYATNSTRTKQFGFYSKILSASEQALNNEPELAAFPFENFVWLLWSIKESAFKYLQRINPELVFSPTKFVVKQFQIPFGYSVVNFDSTKTEGIGFDSKSKVVFKGTINFGCYSLYSRSIIYKELIFTVVNGLENFENTYWGVKLINNPSPQYQSMAVREFLSDRLHRLFPMENLVIGKSLHGFPILLKGSKEIAIPVSLSHHDRLIAYSLQTHRHHKNYFDSEKNLTRTKL